jgi:hypothetical protein
MNKPLSAAYFKKWVRSLDKESSLRFHYCYQIGSTFVQLSQMERSIIHAMAMCDRVRVAQMLGDDATYWEKFTRKHTKLQASTLGNLIKILSGHTILKSDLEYLNWLKEKRDLFVHRWFRNEVWPGEMSIGECQAMIRKLMYLEIIFARASSQIWKILGRADLIAIHDFGADGLLMSNPDTMAEVFGNR